MITQKEAIIEAFKVMGGTRSIDEVKNWVAGKYGNRWNDFSTVMADMVAPSHKGNPSSKLPEHFRVLERVSPGQYRLLK